jgi:hypothetical protein
MDEITREDVVDTIGDPENTGALDLLTQYYDQQNGAGGAKSALTKNALLAARLLYDAKRYEDVQIWLDAIATRLSDEEGPDSDAYAAFTEDEDLEALRLKAADKSIGEEEMDEDDFDDDDE